MMSRGTAIIRNDLSRMYPVRLIKIKVMTTRRRSAQWPKMAPVSASDQATTHSTSATTKAEVGIAMAGVALPYLITIWL
jgi:hypothetical protein